MSDTNLSLDRILRNLYETFGGKEGMVQLRASWKQWETEHPDLPFPEVCMCPCSRRGHNSSLCEDRAALLKPFGDLPQQIEVPMCQPCATQPNKPTEAT